MAALLVQVKTASVEAQAKQKPAASCAIGLQGAYISSTFTLSPCATFTLRP